MLKSIYRATAQAVQNPLKTLSALTPNKGFVCFVYNSFWCCEAALIGIFIAQLLLAGVL